MTQLSTLKSKVLEQRKALLRKDTPTQITSNIQQDNKITLSSNLIFSLFTLNGVIQVSEHPIFVITQNMIDEACLALPVHAPVIQSFIAAQNVVMYIDSAKIDMMQYLKTSTSRPMTYEWIAQKPIASSEFSRYIVKRHFAYTPVTFQEFLEACLPMKHEHLFFYFKQHKELVFAGVKTSQGVFTTIGNLESLRGALTLLPGRKILFCDSSTEILQEASSFIDIQTMHGAYYQQINTFAEICGAWGVPYWRGKQHIPEEAYQQIVATHTYAVERLWYALEQVYREKRMQSTMNEIIDAIISTEPYQDYTETVGSFEHD